MKKFLVIILSACMLFLSCGCNVQMKERQAIENNMNASENQAVEKEYVPFFSDDVAGMELYSEYTDFAEELTEYELAEEEKQHQLNEILEELTAFLNNNYQVDWKYSVICMKIADMEVISETIDNGIKFGAMYYDDAIWVQKDFIQNEQLIENHQAYYVLSHELLHYLFVYNTGGKFYLTKETDMGTLRLGNYLEEAFVDELARRFALSKGFSMSEISSRYKYIRSGIDILEITEPDVFQYFLKNDIQGLREEFNSKVQKRLICEGDQFEKFAYLVDINVKLPTEKNVSMLFTILVAITPKNEYEELNSRQKNVFKVEEDFSSVMKP